MTIRTLDELMIRILKRTERINLMIESNINGVVVDFERKVLDSLSSEYKNRINRMHRFIGV